MLWKNDNGTLHLQGTFLTKDALCQRLMDSPLRGRDSLPSQVAVTCNKATLQSTQSKKEKEACDNGTVDERGISPSHATVKVMKQQDGPCNNLSEFASAVDMGTPSREATENEIPSHNSSDHASLSPGGLLSDEGYQEQNHPPSPSPIPKAKYHPAGELAPQHAALDVTSNMELGNGPSPSSKTKSTGSKSNTWAFGDTSNCKDGTADKQDGQPHIIPAGFKDGTHLDDRCDTEDPDHNLYPSWAGKITGHCTSGVDPDAALLFDESPELNGQEDSTATPFLGCNAAEPTTAVTARYGAGSTNLHSLCLVGQQYGLWSMKSKILFEPKWLNLANEV